MKRIILLALTWYLHYPSPLAAITALTAITATNLTLQVRKARLQSRRQSQWGLSMAFPKSALIDEAGKWQGYDYETLVEIDELLPQYVFKYEGITDFQAAFVGLDTKAFDILSIHASWTEERAAKYLLGDASHL